MNTAAIAHHLNIVESAIIRCEEWASVLFVVARGLGARFVSKKVSKKMNRIELAKKIAKSINDAPRERGADNLSAKVWAKGGKVRIYITDEDLTNAAERGYLSILSGGEISRNGITRKVYFPRCVDFTQTAEPDKENDQPSSIRSHGRYTLSGKPEWCFGAADEESF